VSVGAQQNSGQQLVVRSRQQGLRHAVTRRQVVPRGVNAEDERHRPDDGCAVPQVNSCEATRPPLACSSAPGALKGASHVASASRELAFRTWRLPAGLMLPPGA
jgi:hypothetical protein